MRAVVLRELSHPPRLEGVPTPDPAEDEILLTVRAAALKPIDKQLAAGTHFASPREFPAVCGTDGVGQLPDGSRVFFGGPRRPYGAFAERTIVRRPQCFAVPENLDDATAAAIPNPGVSAWHSLSYRAKLARGETVLVLGATGITGKLAVQVAKLLGARRVVGAGRNPEALTALPALGADATISLNQSRDSLMAAFRPAKLRKTLRLHHRLCVGPAYGSLARRHHHPRIRRCRLRNPSGASRRIRRSCDPPASCCPAQHGAHHPRHGRHSAYGRPHRSPPPRPHRSRPRPTPHSHRTAFPLRNRISMAPPKHLTPLGFLSVV
jgi:hypothetical protein